MVWHSHLFKNFSQFIVIHIVKGFCIVNEADVFLEFLCFLYDPVTECDYKSMLSRLNNILIILKGYITVKEETYPNAEPHL